MNSVYIQNKLSGLFDNYNYKLRNTYVYEWESDFFAISKSGYSVEIEIKISRSDFLADFKKTNYVGKNKHLLLNDPAVIKKSNKFFFACPSGLIKCEDISYNYGLIWVEKGRAALIRDAKFLHKNKILENPKYLKILLDKFYFRNIDLRKQMELRDSDLKYGQGKLYSVYDY